VWRGLWIGLALAVSGCTSQFSLGPAAWTTAAPVIPGYHAVPLGNGGFMEQPDAAPAAPAPSAIEQTLEGLEQAQKVRTAVRQLAR